VLYRSASVETATGTPLVVEKSVFAPSPALWAAWRVGGVTGQRFRREFLRELRDRYRKERGVWVDLCEQAALEDVWLVGEPVVTEVVKECVVKVGEERGLALDPGEELDELGVTLMESARRKVLEGVGVKSELELMNEVAPSRGKGR